MKATKVIDGKLALTDGRVIQRVVWILPEPTADRPHGLKYRLYCGKEGRCIVRYDNETGKEIMFITVIAEKCLIVLLLWNT